MSDCKTYWLHALTPVHAGVGFGSGFIDLPIMREKLTNWPLIPGSSVKGVLRDRYEMTQNSHLELAFGKGGDENSNAGAIVFTDARVVCLATRSYYGTFAYVTSPMVLSRLARDADATGAASLKNLPAVSLSESAVVPADDSVIRYNGQTCLGELNLPCTASSEAATWAAAIASAVFADETWAKIFTKRFVIVPDATFDFLCETGCEVNARIAIDRKSKTVKNGHFWYEESLPAESILSGLVWCDRVYEKEAKITSAQLLAGVCDEEQILQIGGKATVGKGRMRCLYA